MISSLLVVCTGNICRSPIAEGLLKVRGPGLTVSSAGIGAMINWPADPLAVEVMADLGHDISDHRARQITRDMLSSNDLILTLDYSHGAWLNSRFPEYRGKVHQVLRWRENSDVPDPYRQPKAAFQQAYELIDQGVNDWLKRLK